MSRSNLQQGDISDLKSGNRHRLIGCFPHRAAGDPPPMPPPQVFKIRILSNAMPCHAMVPPPNGNVAGVSTIDPDSIGANCNSVFDGATATPARAPMLSQVDCFYFLFCGHGNRPLHQRSAVSA